MLADAHIISSTYKDNAATYRKTWEDKAANLFKVQLNANDAQQSVKDYWTNTLGFPESLISTNSHAPENVKYTVINLIPCFSFTLCR